MNFTNCHVTIHAVNNYATVTVSDPSNNTTFDISASNAYSPYYNYGYYSGSNVCCHPITNSYGPIGVSGEFNYLRMAQASGPAGTTGTAGMAGATGTARSSEMSRPMYSYYN